MINYTTPPAVPTGFALTKTTITLEAATLNSTTTSASFDFTLTPILFVTFQNNAGINFDALLLKDGASRYITHNVSLFINAYSICFSGSLFGDPLNVTLLRDLDQVAIEWAFDGSAIGSVLVNIYSFPI
jgi:hypothetical protein